MNEENVTIKGGGSSRTKRPRETQSRRVSPATATVVCVSWRAATIP
jgi:hypothetical protein